MSTFNTKYPYGLTAKDFLVYNNGRIVLHRISKDDFSIDTIHDSLHFGLYKILDIFYDKHKNKIFTIEFIKTGYITMAAYSAIKYGKVKDNMLYKVFIGKIYSNNSGKLFKIISYQGLNKDNRYIFEVEFIESGEIVSTDIYQISIGKVRDPALIIDNKIFKHGDLEYNKSIRKKDPELYRSLQHRWDSMLDRCYNKYNNSYYRYGKTGVYVCERWHIFSNYLHDVVTLSGYDRNKIVSGEIQLDKDKLQYNLTKKVYSPETCCWLTIDDNNPFNMKKEI